MASVIRFALIVALLYMLSVAWLWNSALNDQAKTSKAKSVDFKQLASEQAQLQHGFVTSLFDQEVFHSKDLATAISYIPNHHQGNNFIWHDRGGNPFAYAALGLDQRYYFASSYLIGFEPYKTDKVWQPLVTLALRKTYQFDHDQYGPALPDVWQNSKQAYYYSHGDCEDHAILLADWLINMGYDARVAIGRVPSGGHAWVVLYHDGKEYLLEATNKRRPRSISDFKLAKYAPEYRPEYLFNRQHFWVNTGSTMTTRYSGKHWQQTSRFFARYNRP